MSMQANKRRMIAAAAVLVAVIGLGTWWTFSRESEASFSMDDGKDGKMVIKQTVTDAQGTREVKLDDKQLAQMQERARGHMTQMLDAYFKLPAGKARRDWLDKQIDQQEEVRKLMEQEKSNPQPPATQPGETRRVIVRGGGGAAAQKQMAESLPAEYQARMAEYVQDMKQRRAERGLPPAEGGIMVRINRPN